MKLRSLFVAVALAAVCCIPAHAAKRVKSPRLYVLDCGDIRPMDPTLYFALGVTLAQRADCTAARAAFAQALALKPGFSSAAEQMVKCKVQAGKREETGSITAVKQGNANH